MSNASPCSGKTEYESKVGFKPPCRGAARFNVTNEDQKLVSSREPVQKFALHVRIFLLQITADWRLANLYDLEGLELPLFP